MEGVTLLPPTGVLGSVSSSLEVWVLHSLCQTHIALLSCPFSRSKHKLLYLLAIFDPWESGYYIQFTYLSFFHWTSMHIAYHVLGHQAKSKKSPHTHTPGVLSFPKSISLFQSVSPQTPTLAPIHTHSNWDWQFTFSTDFSCSSSHLLRPFFQTIPRSNSLGPGFIS